MPNFDESRRIDLAKAERLINDPTVPDRVKRKVLKARKAIISQNRDNESQSLRHQLLSATRAGDGHAVENITEKIKRSDAVKDYDRHREGHIVGQ